MLTCVLILLGEGQCLVDAVRAAKHGTELTLNNFLKLLDGYLAELALLLGDIKVLYLNSKYFGTVLVWLTKVKDLLIRVEWEPLVLGAHRDHGLLTVKNMLLYVVDGGLSHVHMIVDRVGERATHRGTSLVISYK